MKTTSESKLLENLIIEHESLPQADQGVIAGAILAEIFAMNLIKKQKNHTLPRQCLWTLL